MLKTIVAYVSKQTYIVVHVKKKKKICQKNVFLNVYASIYF